MINYKYRMIAISDLHLGTTYWNSVQLLNFLKENSSESLHLVGDIVDTWHLGKNWYWDETQEEIVNHIMERAQTSAVYLYTGNHDENNVSVPLNKFAPLELLESSNYKTLKGKKYLIAHGHQFDSNWLRTTSDLHFSLAMMMNNWYFHSGFIKKFLATIIVKITTTREKTLFKNVAKSLGPDYDGIICGHLHKPRVDKINDKLSYYNTGDWVGHNTFLVETLKGQLELIDYHTNKVYQ